VADKKVKIGFVGVGGMGQCAHLKNYAALSDCVVTAIAEVKPEMAKKVAAKYGIPKVYKDHKELMDKEQLDGIVASQPFNRHGALIPELLQKKVPVFIEKPLAGSIASAEKILAAKKKTGTTIMVGYHKRSDPATICAKEEIDKLKASGELGPMKYVRILMPAGDWIQGGFNDLIKTDEPNPPLDWDPPAPDMDEATFKQYTSFVNYYIHQVNLMRHLLGEAYEVKYADPSGVMLAVRSKSGIAGVIEMTPYRTTLDWQEHALVAFEKGYVKLDLPAPLASNRAGKVEILRDPGNNKTPETIFPQMPSIHAMRRQAMNFIAVVRDGAKPPCEATEAIEDLKVSREYIKLLKGV
jgi:predicted dehydrogenase